MSAAVAPTPTSSMSMQRDAIGTGRWRCVDAGRRAGSMPVGGDAGRREARRKTVDRIGGVRAGAAQRRRVVRDPIGRESIESRRVRHREPMKRGRGRAQPFEVRDLAVAARLRHPAAG
jgi:hypothetical protein